MNYYSKTTMEKWTKADLIEYIENLKEEIRIDNNINKNKIIVSVNEFAEKLKNKLSDCSGCYIPNCFETPTDEFAYAEKDLLNLIDELLKEYNK